MGKTIIPRSEIPVACDERFAPLHHDSYLSWRKLGIVRSGISHVVDGYQMGRGPNQQLMLILTTVGKGYAHSEQESWGLIPGSMFICGPAQPVAFGCAGSDWTMYWWYLDVPADLEIDYRFADCEQAAVLAANMEALFSELGDIPRDQEWRAQIAGMENDNKQARSVLLADLIASYLSEVIDAPLHQQLDNQEQALSVLWREVDRNLHKDWTLNDFADALQVSSATVQRWMHKQYAKSCHQLLIERRMQRASQLLLHTDYSLENIAQQLGYADAFTFSNAYKQCYGLAPSHYKLRNQIESKKDLL